MIMSNISDIRWKFTRTFFVCTLIHHFIIMFEIRVVSVWSLIDTSSYIDVTFAVLQLKHPKLQSPPYNILYKKKKLTYVATSEVCIKSNSNSELDVQQFLILDSSSLWIHLNIRVTVITYADIPFAVNSLWLFICSIKRVNMVLTQ